MWEREYPFFKFPTRTFFSMCWSATALFPMLFIVPLTLAKRMPTPAPGCGYSPDPAPAEQCQAVQKLVSVSSGPALPSPARVLILGLSEDPALNSSCNTGKRSNWGIFYIINSDEQPSHPPFLLPLLSLSRSPSLFSYLISFLMFLFFLSCTQTYFLTFFVSPFIFSFPKNFFPFSSIQRNVYSALWEHHGMWSNKYQHVKVFKISLD